MDDRDALRSEVQHRRAGYAQLQAMHQQYQRRMVPALLRGEAALALLARCRNVVTDPALQREIDRMLEKDI
jgi:hypothetical protein